MRKLISASILALVAAISMQPAPAHAGIAADFAIGVHVAVACRVQKGELTEDEGRDIMIEVMEEHDFDPELLWSQHVDHNFDEFYNMLNDDCEFDQ